MGRGEIKKRGNSLCVDFYYKGERIRAAIPHLDARKKAHHKTADSILTMIQAEIAMDNFNLSKYFPDHPKAHLYRTGSNINIAEKLNTWLDRRFRDCEKSTVRDYKSVINYHLIPAFGDFSLSELTTVHVRNWIDTLTISNKRINNVLIPLKAIFLESYQDGLIESNPLDRVRQLSHKNPEVLPFNPDEVSQILGACDGQIHNLIKFAIWTGLRTSELIALTWDDIDIDKKTAFILRVRTRDGNKPYPKTSHSIRKIELNDFAVKSLNSQRLIGNSSGEIFLNPATSQPWKHDGQLRKTAWMPTLKRTSVPYRKPYNTRHTFASNMLSAGVDPIWVAHQLGHKDCSMLRQRYGRYIDTVKTSNIDTINSVQTQYGHTDNATH